MSITNLGNPRRAVVIWGVALGLLSCQVAQGRLRPWDQQRAQWVRSWRSPALDGPMRAVTWFGGSVWALAALAALVSAVWRRGRGPEALTLVVAFLFGVLIETALRLFIPQWRPDTAAVPPGLGLVDRARLAGFPSGHAFRSAFLFGWLGQEFRAWRGRLAGIAQGLCVAMIGLVGISRLYLNRHWATDVLGGWLVALLVLSVAAAWRQSLAHGEKR